MKQMLLIGLNSFGVELAMQLHALGHQVMAVDRDEARVNAILPIVTDAQIGDSTNEVFLRSLGVNNYDVCFVAIGNDFQSSLETTSLLKELGASLVVSRADREVQAKFLLRNGADEVINPEKQIAQWASIRYGANHILDYTKLDQDHAIIEVSVPQNWLGKSVGEIDIRKHFGINLLAVKENGQINLSITPETRLERDRSLLVLGTHQALQKCFRLY